MKNHSLYYHIPFCTFACHYCDFVKTADFNETTNKAYFDNLYQQTLLWLDRLKISPKSVPTLFFGGGTPGLFVKEYQPLMDLVSSYLQDKAEVCLEVNPNDITKDSLEGWRALGFNRLSIGVQSFDSSGLKGLTRNHSSDMAVASIELATKYFNNVSVDLIYGWPEQTLASWKKDLELAVGLYIQHLSCYNLTYEEGTPFAKKLKRQVIAPLNEDLEEQMYLAACHALKENGYDHYEVSNWAKEGFESQHNQRYWSMEHYVAIGSGAHGFVEEGEYGTRYSYSRSIKDFYQEMSNIDILIDERGKQQWLEEMVLTGLRTAKGISTQELWKDFSAKEQAKYLDQLPKDVFATGNGRIRIKEPEWFRANSHIRQVLTTY